MCTLKGILRVPEETEDKDNSSDLPREQMVELKCIPVNPTCLHDLRSMSILPRHIDGKSVHSVLEVQIATMLLQAVKAHRFSGLGGCVKGCLTFTYNGTARQNARDSWPSCYKTGLG